MRGWGRTAAPDSDEASDAEVRDRLVRVVGPACGESAATPAVFVSTQDQLGTVGAAGVVGLGAPVRGGAGPAAVDSDGMDPHGADHGGAGSGGLGSGGAGSGRVGAGVAGPGVAGAGVAGAGVAGAGGVGAGGPGSSRVSAAALAAFDPGRRGVRAIAVVAVVVAVVAGFLAWQSRSRAQPVPSRALAPAVSVSTVSMAAQATVVVAVAGKVRRPGLVRLPSGARVADAIEAAGGMLPDADIAYLNLARKLADGELVLVGVSPSTAVDGTGSAGASTPGGKVNLNTAGLTELQSLPGVGPVLAQRILDYRTKHGPFASPADLRKVEGIGNARFDQLKELISV